MPASPWGPTAPEPDLTPLPEWLSPAIDCRHTHPIGNLAELIEPHRGEAIALVDGDETVTYEQLRSRVGALRAELLTAGVTSGDTVVLACGNEACKMRHINMQICANLIGNLAHACKIDLTRNRRAASNDELWFMLLC